MQSSVSNTFSNCVQSCISISSAGSKGKVFLCCVNFRNMNTLMMNPLKGLILLLVQWQSSVGIMNKSIQLDIRHGLA